MRVAVISDIHANLPALLAVVEAAAEAGCSDLWCLGDVVGRGPHPNEVIEELRRLRVPTVQGNWDEAVGLNRGQTGSQFASEEAERAADASLVWTTDQVSDANKGWLRTLTLSLRMPIGEMTALAFHGSPYRTTEYLSADRPSRVFARIAADEGDQLFLFGHTHDQLDREAGVVHFVNPGAAGCPTLPGLAPWAVVGVEEGTLAVEFQTAAFDQDLVLNDLRAARMDPDLLTAPPLGRAAARV